MDPDVFIEFLILKLLPLGIQTLPACNNLLPIRLKIDTELSLHDITSIPPW